MPSVNVRRPILPLILLLLIASAGAGCAAVEGIFKAGVWSGLIIAIIVIALVGFLLTKLRR
jgi:hypothetical protein